MTFWPGTSRAPNGRFLIGILIQKHEIFAGEASGSEWTILWYEQWPSPSMQPITKWRSRTTKFTDSFLHVMSSSVLRHFLSRRWFFFWFVLKTKRTTRVVRFCDPKSAESRCLRTVHKVPVHTKSRALWHIPQRSWYSRMIIVAICTDRQKFPRCWKSAWHMRPVHRGPCLTLWSESLKSMPVQAHTKVPHILPCVPECR